MYKLPLLLSLLLLLTACGAPPQADAARSPAPDPAPEPMQSTPQPEPEPTPEPGREASDPGLYAALLAGDVSQVEAEYRDRLAADFAQDWGWEYTLIDLSGDGAPELFLRAADAPALSRIFHAEDGALQCWYWQDSEMCYTWEPLTDGTILTVYEQGGGVSHTIYTLDQDGNRSEPLESWGHHYGDIPPETLESWSRNGEALTEEDYSRQLETAVESKRITDWTPLDLSGGSEEEAPNAA